MYSPESVATERQEKLKKWFPQHEEIAYFDASILKRGDEIVKVYGQGYELEAIQKYADLTNRLADELNGTNLEIRMVDGVIKKFKILINRVDEVDVLENGQVFTRNKFVDGQNLEEEYYHIVTLKDQPPANWLDEQMIKGRLNTLGLFEGYVNEFLKEHTVDGDDLMIRMNEQNMKVEIGNENVLHITDLSSKISNFAK